MTDLKLEFDEGILLQTTDEEDMMAIMNLKFISFI